MRPEVNYLEAWLRGVGCVPIYNLMEDAATAEICRAQVWQWVKYGSKFGDGGPVTAAGVNGVGMTNSPRAAIHPPNSHRQRGFSAR